MAEQGTKTGRRERHRAATRKLKERKRIRRQRAEYHGAMQEAERIRKSRKKGHRDFDKFMRELGYEPRESVSRTNCLLVGRQIPGDVLDKYERVP